MDDHGFYDPVRDQNHELEGDLGASLSTYIKALPEYDSLEIQYQGSAALSLMLTGKERSLSRFIGDRLPPGRSLSDYQLTLQDTCVALLPRRIADAIFSAAEACGLLEARISAIPKVEMHSEQILWLRNGRWYQHWQDKHLYRFLPFIDNRLPSDIQQPASETDLRTTLFEPYITWLDPAQEKRLTAKANQGVLILASIIVALVLSLSGLGLLAMSHYYEGRLTDLTSEQQIIKANRKQYNRLYDQLQTTLQDIGDLHARREALVPRAITMRHMLNLAPQQVQLTRLVFEQDLEDRHHYRIEGLAPDPATVNEFVRSLDDRWKTFDTILNRLEARPEPQQRRNIRSRNRNAKASPDFLPYTFLIALEPKS